SRPNTTCVDICLFSFYVSDASRLLHSFPTRRSSDLGVGDLRGIIDRLDYLNDGTHGSLGIRAIWLSPIYLSPGRDGGYDVADHKDRKSTRLNSSHLGISYAVFCLKKKNTEYISYITT